MSLKLVSFDALIFFYREVERTSMMAISGVVAAAVAIVVATGGAFSGATAASSRLDIIDLPVGFFPEGIALAEDWTVYVGSYSEGR